MNNESAFAPSNSLKGEPAKATEVKIKMVGSFKIQAQSPQGFRGELDLAE